MTKCNVNASKQTWVQIQQNNCITVDAYDGGKGFLVYLVGYNLNVRHLMTNCVLHFLGKSHFFNGRQI